MIKEPSGWSALDLPHDWAVELPFSEHGSNSHGYKAIGRNFPENSVGWYRRKFTIPESDLGKRVSVEFDGVFRDSIVWVNGHYLGRDESGYSGFSRNLTEFLNYGGENIIAVRVDASLEEGWFYEGAGIYRHVWLVKTAPLHVERNGTSVISEIKDKTADVTSRVAVVNEGEAAATFDIEQAILDGSGKTIATAQSKHLKIAAGGRGEFRHILPVSNPMLWSIETPNLYRLVTTIASNGLVMDRYETSFGIGSGSDTTVASTLNINRRSMSSRGRHAQQHQRRGDGVAGRRSARQRHRRDRFPHLPGETPHRRHPGRGRILQRHTR